MNISLASFGITNCPFSPIFTIQTGEDLSADPTLPVWSQLQREIEQIKEEVVTPEQMTEILSGIQSAVQAAAIYAGRAESAAKQAEEAANGQNPNYGGGLSAAAKEALMAVVHDAMKMAGL